VKRQKLLNSISELVLGPERAFPSKWLELDDLQISRNQFIELVKNQTDLVVDVIHIDGPLDCLMWWTHEWTTARPTRIQSGETPAELRQQLREKFVSQWKEGTIASLRQLLQGCSSAEDEREQRVFWESELEESVQSVTATVDREVAIMYDNWWPAAYFQHELDTRAHPRQQSAILLEMALGDDLYFARLFEEPDR
jgi:hypothetical protein